MTGRRRWPPTDAGCRCGRSGVAGRCHCRRTPPSRTAPPSEKTARCPKHLASHNVARTHDVARRKGRRHPRRVGRFGGFVAARASSPVHDAVTHRNGARSGAGINRRGLPPAPCRPAVPWARGPRCPPAWEPPRRASPGWARKAALIRSDLIRLDHLPSRTEAPPAVPGLLTAPRCNRRYRFALSREWLGCGA